MVKIHVFDVDRLAKHVLGRFWPNWVANKAEKDLKMAPQNDPKSIKIDFEKNEKIIKIKGDKGGPGPIYWQPRRGVGGRIGPQGGA